MPIDDVLQLWLFGFIMVATLGLGVWRLAGRRLIELAGEWLCLWSGGSLAMVLLEAL